MWRDCHPSDIKVGFIFPDSLSEESHVQKVAKLRAAGWEIYDLEFYKWKTMKRDRQQEWINEVTFGFHAKYHELRRRQELETGAPLPQPAHQQAALSYWTKLKLAGMYDPHNPARKRKPKYTKGSTDSAGISVSNIH